MLKDVSGIESSRKSLRGACSSVKMFSVFVFLWLYVLLDFDTFVLPIMKFSRILIV